MTAALGPLLRALRQAADLTIEELSHASGVSVRAIGDMERGVSRGPQRRTVQALADALGLDETQRAALADAARAGRPRTPDQAPRSPGSFGLPRGLADFVGRTPELDLVLDRARTASADGPPSVVVLHGAGGLGKTACAVRAAELLRDAFPDGALYVDLRGVDPEPMPTAEALQRLLRASGMDPRAIAEDEQERTVQLRTVLTERRMLLVLDNAADEAQARPLLPATGAGMAIVTSRRALGGLAGVTRIPLAPFSPEESAELLRAVSGESSGHGTETARVAELCGHLPLALRIAGTRLASRPGWTVRHLADRLSDEDRRLANLAVGDVGVEAAFALSYVALPERARACFRRLALVPAVDFGAPVVAVLTGSDLDDAADQLDGLVELGLLQHEGADRYRFHDLIRLYASRRLHEEESAEARNAAERRMTEWILETATAAGRWFDGGDDDGGAVAMPQDGAGRVRLETPEQARDWLQAEKDTWLAALRLAGTGGQDERIARFGEAMRWFAANTQYWSDDWLDVFGRTRAAAARLGARRRELWHRNREVWALLAVRRTGGKEGVRDAVDRAMEVYRLAEELGAVREQADAVCNAAEGWRVTGDADETLRCYSRGRELAEAAGYLSTYYWAAGGTAVGLTRAGRHDEAIDAYHALLRTIDELPAPSAAAQHSRTFALSGLSGALIAAERFEEAVEVGESTLARTIAGGSDWTSITHWMLGRAHVGLGDTDAARAHLARTIELAEEEGTWRTDSLDQVRALLAEVESARS